MTMLGEDGFVRVVARADNHLVLGIQAVGQGVSELSAAFSLAVSVTEREGFEPSTHLSARTRFPVALLRPLGHLSDAAG